MSDARNYMGWILDSFRRELRAPVLEIGVGHGSYAEALRELGEYVGLDIDRESIAAAKQRFPDLPFHAADITQQTVVELAGEGHFNTVVCLNVIEHIPDHEGAVANLAAVLAKGGHLVIVVPALSALYNDLDRLAGHIRRYRTIELRELFAKAGLETVRSDYFNPIGGLGWLANRLVRHNSLNDTAVNGQIALFDKWAVPVSRAIDPVTRRFFGQSVVAIGRKS